MLIHIKKSQGFDVNKAKPEYEEVAKIAAEKEEQTKAIREHIIKEYHDESEKGRLI